MKRLVVLLGATGVGKTDLSIRLAQYMQCPIISSDSRQIYREMTTGTAVPEKEQLNAVQHYFIHSRSIFDDYTAGKFELDAIDLINSLFQHYKQLLMVGGSGLYIDAVCKGIDVIPATDNWLRQSIIERYKNEGIESLRFELKRLDAKIYNQIDIKNPQRVMRALEVCLTSGKPYSELKQNFAKKRNFDILKIGLQISRNELYDKINSRVDKMFEQGLLNEAGHLYEHRNINALKTVGYKEIFEYFDGKISLDEAVNLIKRNTRRYAKRQMSWFARYNDIQWFHPADFEGIIKLCNHSKIIRNEKQ
ncbi:MAG: tRNA (adenosine(37)-N6)-dimethylallyltransferase MiaA [Prevotellaceae bacterium]|jgi:tRNA dimethylallyltransferase|nr:tRNA (adenosine(37)-N6)-dimethylallyltransferase MiaA [Prevotellaceae bacterium]